MSINTTGIHQGPVRVALFLVCFFPALAKAAVPKDFCEWDRFPSSTLITLELPDPILRIDERVAIGSTILRVPFRSDPQRLPTLTCSVAPNTHKYSLNGLKLVAGYPDVYQSGIEGIGLRIFSSGSSGSWIKEGYVPSHDSSAYNAYTPRNQFALELVRMGQRVGSGTISLDFYVNLTSYVVTHGTQFRLAWRSTGSATVINEAMYASCEPAKPVVTVDMGEVPGKDVKAGRAPVTPFSFDVRCKGIKRPNHLVRAYFEGNSPRTGVLDVQVGAAGQASGVALALTDAQNNPLHFGSGRTYPLGFTGEDAEGHLYRFEGNAQYIPTDAPLVTGQADASLTYVLDYN
ncbi:fimbrial protein [Pseudomonas sp. BN411]|uniref:fimbrial protein n=1 Tax=Pseudomonas sp. BN411 TaxID=2567887 RepID=UPI002458FEFD|nr:fimbrial protein [Pseudomonas sp. BN411]MDH4563845.1 fimbrial protein [Pseudomonas sp. BN411]